MKAMIFAAGLGSRLRPITDTMPKALVEVGGIPVIQHAIQRLKSAGITDIVVNVHHFSGMIRDFLQRNDNFGVDISISDETECLLDTGGGLMNALNLLGTDEPVLLYNADVVTDFPLKGLIDRFDKAAPDAMLFIGQRDSSRKLLFNDKGQMKGWINLSTGETLPENICTKYLHAFSFNGIHIVSPRLFPLLTEYSVTHGAVFSITPFYIAVCGRAAIYGYKPEREYRWFDIGKPDSLYEARKSFDKLKQNIYG